MTDTLSFSSALDTLPLRVLHSLYAKHPKTVLALSLGALLATPPWLSYRAYVGRKAAAGAYTSDFAGWLQRTMYRPFFRETRSTAMYDADPYKSAWFDRATFPMRKGDRPAWDSNAGPQRQLDQLPCLEMQAKISDALAACAAMNPDLVRIERSPNETQSPGMVLDPRIPTLHNASRAASREVAHIHADSDFSMHILLAPQDCKLLIERGWAERHPIAGSIKLPKEYMFVYAPRDDEELLVVQKILRAATGFMAGSRSVC